MTPFRMRMPIALVLGLLLSLPALSQEVIIKPKWKAGETRTIWLTETTRSYEEGELTEEKEDRLDAKVKVMSEDSTRIMIEVDIRNAMLKQFLEISDKLGTDLDPWKRLILRYRLDKKDGSTTLFNWEDVSERILSSYEQVRRSLRKQEPELLEVLDLVLTPTMQLYKQQSVVEGLFANQLSFLTSCLFKPFNTEKPLEVRESAPNPFDPSGPKLTMISNYHVDELDREAGRCTIRTVETLDAEAFSSAMRFVMETMVKAMPGEEMTKQQKADMERVMGSMRFDMQSEQTVTMDMNKGWPLRAVRTSNGSYSMEGRSGNSETRITAEVR